MRTFDERIADLISEIAVDNWDVFYRTLIRINKALNADYYSDDENERDKNHLILSGSMGRGTGIKGKISDIDVCYILPNEIYDRFNKRQGNIQSQLLTEIKEKISQHYPNTELNSDGQVVDLKFNRYTVELVPCFKLSTYDPYELTHPDSNNGGSWQKTYPRKSIQSFYGLQRWNPNYSHLCRLFRRWRDEKDIHIKGIVIDLLLKQFFIEGKWAYDMQSSLSKAFDFFAKIQEGSSFLDFSGNEQIFVKDFSFKSQANKAYDTLNDSSLSISEKLKTIFGNYNSLEDNEYEYQNHEEYIEDLFSNQPTFSCNLDCDVERNGFRQFGLKEFLLRFSNRLLKQKATLKFKGETDVPEPFDVYWKVRNVGDVAKKRNCLRGKLEKTNSLRKQEYTNFYGPHFVEVYFVKNNIVVARDKIDVPIDND